MAGRSEKFWWEYKREHFITLQSMRGTYDPALSSDCRCGRECENCEFGNYCDIKPWMALHSTECWGEEILTPDGLADGDTCDSREILAPFHDRIACDICGYSYFNEWAETEADIPMAEDDLAGKEGDKEFRKIYRVEEKYSESADEKAKKRGSDQEENEKAKINGYEYSWDNLPFFEPKSHEIIASCPQRISKKNLRRNKRKGSYSHGWRGSDRYKDERRGRIRASKGKLRRFAKNTDYVFVYGLAKEQRQRTSIV